MTDVRDFCWFVLDEDDEVIALFKEEKNANAFIGDNVDDFTKVEGYFNFDSSCSVST